MREYSIQHKGRVRLNKRIREEIAARLANARANLPDLPVELEPLLKYYEAQSFSAPAKELIPKLIESFQVWPRDESMQAAGFEWYYDGTDEPHALGYAYESVEKEPQPAEEPPGGDTHRARDDFDGDVEFGSMLFGDSGGFDVGAACFPVFKVHVSGLENEEDEAWEALINLYTLRMFHRMHIALAHATRSDAFQALKIKTPFYFFANNHDWNPFLIFAYEGEPEEGPAYELGEAKEIEEAGLDDWLREIIRRGQEQESREDRIRAAGKAGPGELEKILLELPELKYGRGETLTLSKKELNGFASQTLSRAEYHQTVSFEAFAHLLELLLAARGANLYDIHGPMIFLFLRDSEHALEWSRDFLARKPKKWQKKQEVLLDCARNAVRWAEDQPEHRWPNPSLALSESRSARKAMRKLTGD